MDFWKTMLVLLRRWKVAVPVFTVSVGLAGVVFLTTPTYYSSTGMLVLTVPPGGAIVEADPARKTTLNPLLAFDDGLKISATILIQTLSSPDVVQQLTSTNNNDDTYTVNNGNVEGPFIAVKAQSKTAESAQNLVDKVLNRARWELQERQEKLRAPAETYIQVGEVVTPTLPTEVTSSKMRAAGAALVIGIAMTLTAAYGLESYSARRRKRGRPATTRPRQHEVLSPSPQPAGAGKG